MRHKIRISQLVNKLKAPIHRQLRLKVQLELQELLEQPQPPRTKRTPKVYPSIINLANISLGINKMNHLGQAGTTSI